MLIVQPLELWPFFPQFHDFFILLKINLHLIVFRLNLSLDDFLRKSFFDENLRRFFFEVPIFVLFAISSELGRFHGSFEDFIVQSVDFSSFPSNLVVDVLHLSQNCVFFFRQGVDLLLDHFCFCPCGFFELLVQLVDLGHYFFAVLHEIRLSVFLDEFFFLFFQVFNFA